MVKQIMIHHGHELVMSSENEQNTDTYNNLDESPGNYAKQERQVLKVTWRVILLLWHFGNKIKELMDRLVVAWN